MAHTVNTVRPIMPMWTNECSAHYFGCAPPMRPVSSLECVQRTNHASHVQHPPCLSAALDETVSHVGLLPQDTAERQYPPTVLVTLSRRASGTSSMLGVKWGEQRRIDRDRLDSRSPFLLGAPPVANESSLRVLRSATAASGAHVGALPRTYDTPSSASYDAALIFAIRNTLP